MEGEATRVSVEPRHGKRKEGKRRDGIGRERKRKSNDAGMSLSEEQAETKEEREVKGGMNGGRGKAGGRDHGPGRRDTRSKR